MEFLADLVCIRAEVSSFFFRLLEHYRVVEILVVGKLLRMEGGSKVCNQKGLIVNLVLEVELLHD